MSSESDISPNAQVFGKTIVKVGVTSTRYVSLQHARPWVIHSYRNIKGRGLHMEEEGSNTMPMEQTVSEEALENVQTAGKETVNKSTPILGRSSPTLMFHKDGDSAASSSIAKRARLDEPDRDSDCHMSKSDKTESEAAGDIGADIIGSPTETKHDSDEFRNDNAIEKQTEFVSATGNHAEQTSNLDISQEGISKSKKRKVEIVDHDTVNAENEFKTSEQTVAHSKVDVLVSQIATDSRVDIPVSQTMTDSNEDRSMQNEESDIDKGTNSGVRTRQLKKRKHPDETDAATAGPSSATSTYDKVRLVIQPWRKPEGGVNKPILKMMLESVMLYLMMKPGSTETILLQRYLPYLQPVVLRNIVEILEDIGCITRQYLKKPKVTLFSKPVLPDIGSCDGEEESTLYLPTEECLFTLGQFGKEMFPHAKWPSSTTFYGKQ